MEICDFCKNETMSHIKGEKGRLPSMCLLLCDYVKKFKSMEKNTRF